MYSTEADTLIYPGGEIKSIDASGKFGGYIVLFGSAKQTDISRERDYFTADTDFGLDDVKQLRALFDHGLDSTMKRARLASLQLKKHDVGIWADGVLQARDDYEAAVKEIIGKAIPSLISQKKLGFSSGTASHLVERERQPNGANWIKTWPLIEASLTATPAEPRTLALSLKSFQLSFTKGVFLGPMAEPAAAMEAMRCLHDRLRFAIWDVLADEKKPAAERLATIAAGYDECKAASLRLMTALLGDGAGGGDGDGAKRATLLQLEAGLMAMKSEMDVLRYRSES